MQIRGMLIFVSCERCMPFILIHPSFASISTMVSCVFFLVSNTSLHSVEFGHDDLLLGFPVFVMKSVPYRASVGFPRWSLVGESRLHRGRLSRCSRAKFFPTGFSPCPCNQPGLMHALGRWLGVSVASRLLGQHSCILLIFLGGGRGGLARRVRFYCRSFYMWLLVC